MKLAMVAAGTKYFAKSNVSLTRWPSLSVDRVPRILALIMPRRHFLLASKTPDPEFPVVETSAIAVRNLGSRSGGNRAGDIIRDRASASAVATMTGSPGDNGC